MAAIGAFHRFSHGHSDLVLAVDYDYYGARMVTASSDHRLKIWDQKDDQWVVTDVWVGHDAEITGVKWNGPFAGQIIASIAEDGLLRIWQEDPLQPTNTGRRFKQIYEQLSTSRVPYMSLDFKNLGNETYLAITSRDGQLTICEPIDHDDLSEWSIIWQTYLCKTAPPRTEETGFAICWHHEKFPAWPAILSGLDRRSLSIAVAVMDVVKIFRTDKDRKFFLAAELHGATDLIRDVAWANGSMRGFDTIATASKDGHIRVYDLHTPGAEKLSTTGTYHSTDISKSSSNRPVRSGIGAGLAGGALGGRDDDENRPGKVVQEAEMVSELATHENAVWRITFSQLGDLMISTGDDGLVNVWKKDVDQQWAMYAEVDATKQD